MTPRLARIKQAQSVCTDIARWVADKPYHAQEFRLLYLNEQTSYHKE